jgi:hypothetical protein
LRYENFDQPPRRERLGVRSTFDNREFSMHRSHPIEALIRLFTLQHHSLPQYLLHASPYVRPGDEQILQTLREVASRQKTASRRIAETILSRRGQLPNSTYPMRYTDTHYLDLRFLLGRLIDDQRLVVKEIERLAAALAHDPVPYALAQGILAQETGHRDLFEEMIAAPDRVTHSSAAEARNSWSPRTRKSAGESLARTYEKAVAPRGHIPIESTATRIAGRSRANRVKPTPSEIGLGG